MSTNPDYLGPLAAAEGVDQADTLFAGIAAAWDERLACEMTTRAGGRCRRPAWWRLNLHGCEQANMCGQHLARWKHCALSSTSRCAHCGHVFPSPAAAYTVSAL